MSGESLMMELRGEREGPSGEGVRLDSRSRPTGLGASGKSTAGRERKRRG